MSLFIIFILGAGLILVVISVLTFYGKNNGSTKYFRLGGLQADRTAVSIGLFLLGMIFILIFLIEVMGPHFVEEGL